MAPGERYADTGVLVTGAQGFIGCWLAERLLDHGARVVVPCRDRHPASRFWTEGIAARCHVERADILDYEKLLRILREHEVRTVFHLAAQPVVGIANRSPLSTYESNVRGTYTLLEACRNGLPGRVERVVVASSDHAYGDHEVLPYQEDFGLNAMYPYDVSKACTDLIARCYATTYDMPVAVTRLGNTYGAGDCHWSRIVPDTARTLVRGERPVIRSDGSPERDYLYVEDAVDAYLAVAASLDNPELQGRAWNAGCGKPVSVLELVQRLIAVSGKDVEPEIRGEGTPRGEIDRQYLDLTAVRGELGWSPQWELQDGLTEAFGWYERVLTETRMSGEAVR